MFRPLEPGWKASPRRGPGSFREQGAHMPYGDVQRFPVVVQPRQIVTGGTDIHIRHNPFGKKYRSPRYVPGDRTVRESICELEAGLTKAGAEPLRRDIEVRVSAMTPLPHPFRRRGRYGADCMGADRSSQAMVPALSTMEWAA